MDDIKKSMQTITTEVSATGQQLKDQAFEINELKENLRLIHSEVTLSKASRIF